MQESADWFLEHIEFISRDESSVRAQLSFKKQKHQFPLHSRWQVLESCFDIDNGVFSSLHPGQSYILMFDENMICREFRFQLH
jgi:hypothetical protein